MKANLNNRIRFQLNILQQLNSAGKEPKLKQGDEKVGYGHKHIL